MLKTTYKQINETLFSETLANGLQVYLLPKKEYDKVYGLFTTNYGSIDNEFVPITQNEKMRVPDGIAHFLEHKLFEKEEGDVFYKFSTQGASANAFTTFSKTSYLFSASTQVFENLALLLDFVQEPYFTKESVEKEKGIIVQEIQMYQDDANWRLFFGILQNMYPNHPVAKDIAGTIESIELITKEDLYTCYHTFYHPSNMTLFVVGNFDEAEIMAFIKENQAKKNFLEGKEVTRIFPEIAEEKVIPKNKITMEIVRPKFILGVRGLDTLPLKARELLKYKLSMNLLAQAMFGSTSESMLELYNTGIVDDTFDADFTLDRAGHFLTLSGDSQCPDEAVKRLKEQLLSFETSTELTVEKIELLKKKMIGKYFQSLNSLEHIANQFAQSVYEEPVLFDFVDVLEEITREEVLKVAQNFIKEEQMSEFQILPIEPMKGESGCTQK